MEEEEGKRLMVKALTKVRVREVACHNGDAGGGGRGGEGGDI